ncbi:MAG: AAA family ATPase [Actinomycetota bacterium]
MRAVDLDEERAALERARSAAADKLVELRSRKLVAADELSEEYMQAVIRGAIEKLQNELTVFGRIDDDEPWRVGLYGVEQRGNQLVIDWRAPFAQAFYRAHFDDPHGLTRRVSYVGAIDELFIEEFASREVTGSSPLMTELSRGRGDTMKTAVATLQSEQDELVRRSPDERMVLRGGPGTGKTVVGLHRAAWLVYNDRRVLSSDILVLGPSDRYLRYVASVLPTLGETKVRQTTFARLLGPTSEVGSTIDWPAVLDAFEASMYAPQPLKVRFKQVGEGEVADMLAHVQQSSLPWRDKRKGVESALMRRTGFPAKDVRDAVATVMPACSAAQAWKRLQSPQTLRALGLDADTIAAWRAVDEDGPLQDELNARFNTSPIRYSHVVVDEAQDLTEMQLRAVERRSAGLTLVGDDAQISAPGALGLRAIAERLAIEPDELATAYRMSAEIADWLNALAQRSGLPAVELIGIRPTGTAVIERPGDAVATEQQRVENAWDNARMLATGDVWTHKGIEYDAVVVDARGMGAAELYLAASRAAHELVVCGLDLWAGLSSR